jgi:histidine triad (HIT) family protein
VSADCLFCRIVAGGIPAKLVAESEECVAFRDIDPKAPVHVLIIPRRHVSSLDAADDPALLGSVAMMAAQVARDEGVASSGYRTVINTGADAGQSVGHLHMHVLGGRKLTWPPG